jgi:thiol-disulfide isomerase/thioredoxin
MIKFVPKILIVFILIASFIFGFSFYKNKPVSLISKLTLYNLNKAPVVATEILEPGLTIINFWATWCEPCKEEIPELNQFYKTINKAEKIHIVGVAIDEFDAIQDFIKKIPIEYPVYYDERNGFKLSDYLKNDKGVLPYTVVVDQNFNLINQYYGKITQEDLKQLLRSK